MRRRGDGARAALRHVGEQLRILAGQHLQAAVADQRQRFAGVAAAVLDGADVRVGGQRQQRLARQGGAGAVGDVVDDEWHRTGVGQCCEPGAQAILRGPHVMRCRHQQAGQRRHIGRGQALHPGARVGQVVAAQAHDQRQPAGMRRHRAQAGQLLFLRERRRLASGAADDDAADASAGQVRRQPRQCGVVHGPVAKRGDEGNPQAREIGRGNSAGA